MPRVTGVLEICLYVADVERSARFYELLFGFERIVSDEHFCAFAVTAENSRGEKIAAHNVLILFRHGATAQPIALPGGMIPAHDGSGQSHFAFAIPAAELAAWETCLAEAGVTVESRVRWERGGQSIYFRDPDGHLVELATPGVWPMY